MDQQIQQAVSIALSGTLDADLKNQAIDFITQIKSTEQGYKSCLNILIESDLKTINQGLKFFIYQVIDENISKLSNDELFQLNSQLFKVLSTSIVENIDDDNYMKNKFAAIFGKLFYHVYLSICPTFIKDLHLLISSNQLAVDYYTRILVAIHYEIGDKFISRASGDQDQITRLKDAIRTNDMNSLAKTWSDILLNEDNSSEILSNTLKIIGQYINWMEISLFIDNKYINLIFQYLNKQSQRIDCCQTLVEIISKKMKPLNKLQLISLLDLTTIVNSIDLHGDTDVEFMENVAKLLNQMGIELIIVLENEPSLIQETNQQFIKLWPLVFSLLSHEFDDVSQQVFPFIQQYLLLSKKLPVLSSIDLLSTLLNKVILKMKYDDDDDGLDDDDGDEMFVEMRSKLKTFQDTIAILNPELYAEAIPIVINESIFNSDAKVDWRKFELGLFELGNYADSLRNNLINVPKPEINRSKPYMIFQEFLIKLIESDFLINVNHPKIQLKFFELVVKHYTFLNNQSNQQHLVSRLIEIFSSPLGLFNENEKVRLRCWYLFFRFVKLTKPALNNEAFVEDLVGKLQPLVVIKAELPTKDEDNDMIDNGNFNSQVHLFETIGTLISLISNELLPFKLKLLDLTFQPLFNDLEKCVSASDLDKQNQPLLALQAHHSLMALGTIASGMTYENSLKFPQEIINKINNAAQVVLITLESFPKHEVIRDASRFAFARFIPILKNHINVHLSKLITLIVSATNLRINELGDFLSFLGQIVHNYKNDDNIYLLLNNLITPVISKVFEILNQNTDEENIMPDVIRDKYQLKKSFMNFLTAIVINHSSSLLVTETNKQNFPKILSTLFEYAYDVSETSTSKLAVTQLINMVTIFGNGGKINDPEDKYSERLPPLEGMDEFLMNRVSQLCFELPFQKQEFDLKDAQIRLIAQEIALLLKTLQLKKGDEYLNYLSGYLINMGLSQSLTNDFASNLVKSDAKSFKKYFVTFVTELKGNK
jgi:exportin-T